MEIFVIDTKLIAVIAILMCSGAAHAQTVTRTIKVEPVETTITQGADGSTVVTRRPLQNAPAPMTYAPPPLNTLMNGPAQGTAGFVPPPAGAAPPVAQTERAAPPPAPAAAPRKVVRTAQPAGRAATRGASRARPAVAPRLHIAVKPAARSIRPPLRLAAAPVLDAVQRQYIYGAIAQQEMQTAIAFADPDVAVPPVVAATEVVARGSRRPVRYTVGSRLPVTVPLVAMPEAAAEHMRWLARYGYALVNDRVLVVDPDTGIVVADVTQ
jgi:Protein of unknown function (DUF1236)